MIGRIAFGIALAFAGLGLLLATGCNDDGTTRPRIPATGRVFLVPTDLSLDQAPDSMAAGDTLLIIGPAAPASGTVTFRSAQTPLVIRGSKNHPTLQGPLFRALLRFESPRAGTRVEGVTLAGADTGVVVAGSGAITLRDCAFVGGGVQVLGMGSGSGVRITAEDNLMRGAGTFSLDVTGKTALLCRRTTIDQAGDCGIRARGGAAADVRNSIVYRSANYGLACMEGASLADSSGCNDVVDNANGGYLDCTAPESDFSDDPLFCDLEHHVYTLRRDSRCSAENAGECGQVGAYGPACEIPLPDFKGSAAPRPGSR